jgi:Ca2+-binding EF-hand superfamily protein
LLRSGPFLLVPAAFNELDADGSGAIDTGEVKAGLQLCGMVSNLDTQTQKRCK